MIDYIRRHAEQFGVEPICAVLTEHGTQIAPSTYYLWASVKGQRFLPGGGHETCPVTDTSSAWWWPCDLPKGLATDGWGWGQVKGLTPCPASAWVRRMESPLVWQTWAWWRSRSTVAVANVLGISSSNPAGCRFDEIATERFS